MRYHHIGIPTTTPRPGETYLGACKTFCTDHEGNPAYRSSRFLDDGLPACRAA